MEKLESIWDQKWTNIGSSNDSRRQLMSRIVLVFLVFAFSTSLSNAQTAEDLFQQALKVERLSGNAEAAIALYRQIVDEHSSNRVLVARSLLQMGKVYETLGNDGARASYSRIVQEYSDISAVAREAAQRIAALAGLNQQPIFRKIEIATRPRNGVVSPDGKNLAFTSDDGVWMVPLQGKVSSDIAGEPVRIADVPGAWNFRNQLTWSADGKWIAVNGGIDGSDDAYVIPSVGGTPRLIRMPVRGGGAFPHGLSLSPDGGRLAFSAVEIGVPTENVHMFDRHVYVVPTEGGEPHEMSSGRGTFPAFSPDGELIAYTAYREKDAPQYLSSESMDGSELWIAPSAGGLPVKLVSEDGLLTAPIWSPDGKFIATLGASRTEIWVYPVSLDVPGGEEPTRIELGGIRQGMLAGWTAEDELGIFIDSEYQSAVYTVLSSGGKAAQVTPNGAFFYYPRWSPDGKRIFFRDVRPDEDPLVTVAYVAADGGDVVDVSLPGRNFMSRIPGGGHNLSPDGHQLVVSAYFQRPGVKLTMDAWVIPIDGSSPTRLTSDESNEMYPCWSPDGRWVAFKVWHDGATEDEGYDAIYRIPAEGGEAMQIASAADSVGAGAIAFSPDGKRIAYSSNGAIVTIPIDGGEPEVLVADAQMVRHSQLAYSPDVLRIAYNAGGKIWIALLATGETTELRTGLPENHSLSEFDWSPDGEKIVFEASSGGEREFWLVSDFLPEGR